MILNVMPIAVTITIDMIEMVTVMQAGLKRAEDRRVSANMKDDTRNKKNEVNDRKTKSLS